MVFVAAFLVSSARSSIQNRGALFFASVDVRWSVFIIFACYEGWMAQKIIIKNKRGVLNYTLFTFSNHASQKINQKNPLIPSSCVHDSFNTSP